MIIDEHIDTIEEFLVDIDELSIKILNIKNTLE